MKDKKTDLRFFLAAGMIILLAAQRMIYTGALSPLTALALFSGAIYRNKIFSYIFTLIPVMIGDIIFAVINPNFIMQSVMISSIIVYLGLILVTFISQHITKKLSIFNIVFLTILSPVLFYIATNFLVWLGLGGIVIYSKDLNGFLLCFAMGIPFLLKDLIATSLYSILLFGIYDLYSSSWLKARTEKASFCVQ